MNIKKILKSLPNVDKLNLDLNSIKKFDSKGFMSEIYCINSLTIGDLILHIIDPVDEQKKIQIHKKISNFSNYLLNNTSVLTSKVYLAEELKGKYFIIQKKIEGEPLGRRYVEDNKIKDEFYTNNSLEFEEIRDYLSKLHQISLKGFGEPVFINNDIKGEFNTNWYNFLKIKSKEWLENVYLNHNENFMSKKLYFEIKNRIDILLEKNKKILVEAKPSIVLGDANNPSNILFKDKKITGFIDFEWALVADSSWEFAYGELDRLINIRSIEFYNSKKFERKLHVSKILWRLYGINIHIEGNKIKEILFKELLDLLEINE